MTAILPGDSIRQHIKPNEVIKLGNGVEPTPDQVDFRAIVPGMLQAKKGNAFSVASSSTRYIPSVNDQVVGIIEEKGGDFYMVNIFSGSTCILYRQAFDGATKRNKPELNRGDVVYARVTFDGRDLSGDTEIACTSTGGSRKDWSTGETVYGGLPMGLIVRVSTGMAQRLLRPDCPLLLALSRHFAFELAIGVNGVVWFRSSGGTNEAITIRCLLLEGEGLDDQQVVKLVDRLARITR